MFSKDSQEILVAYLSTAIECYKVFIACLFSIFVPQYCPETGSTCTLKENFSNLDRFNEFVIVFNFINLGLFIYLYYCQNSRETYFITHLEANKNIADNGLKTSLKEKTHTANEVSSRPSVRERIMDRVVSHNTHFYKMVKFTMAVFYINVVFSSILVFYYFYDGFRSVTVLVTNVLLVSQKLYQTLSISSTSCNLETPMALSTTLLEPVSYNDVDKKYASDRRGSTELSSVSTIIVEEQPKVIEEPCKEQ
jgi:hypothetical protein